jgi:hypothetical protein
MGGLRYSLLADGSSNRILQYVIEWAVRRLGVRIEGGRWGDLSLLQNKPGDLVDRARRVVELYPCDLLFVHRDAERELFEQRLAEVRSTLAKLAGRYVPVIPVRMTEAWFLHDESAIRRASGNPQGTVPLNLPAVRDVEALPDPKRVLFEALLVATELSGRGLKRKRRDRFRMRMRVAELIDDFEPLVGVPAFDRFLVEVEQGLRSLSLLEEGAG